MLDYLPLVAIMLCITLLACISSHLASQHHSAGGRAGVQTRSVWWYMLRSCERGADEIKQLHEELDLARLGGQLEHVALNIAQASAQDMAMLARVRPV